MHNRKYKDANLLGEVDESEESTSLPTATTTRTVVHKEAVDSQSLDSEEEIDTGEIRRYVLCGGREIRR